MLIDMIFSLFYKLTLSVCVWRWLYNFLHGSRWCYRWCCWRLRRGEGLAWDVELGFWLCLSTILVFLQLFWELVWLSWFLWIC